MNPIIYLECLHLCVKSRNTDLRPHKNVNACKKVELALVDQESVLRCPWRRCDIAGDPPAGRGTESDRVLIK